MENAKVIQLTKVIGVLFALSFIGSLLINYPDYSSSVNVGFSTGLLFKQGLKFLAIMALIVFGPKRLRRRGIKTLG